MAFVFTLDSLSVYVYIYIYICVCVYIYIYSFPALRRFRSIALAHKAPFRHTALQSFSKPHPLHKPLVEQVELRTFGIRGSNTSSCGDVS